MIFHVSQMLANQKKFGRLKVREFKNIKKTLENSRVLIELLTGIGKVAHQTALIKSWRKAHCLRCV